MNSYTKVDFEDGTGDFVMVCDDCGAQSSINRTEVEHYATCIPGECERWGNFYKEASEEEAANLAKDPHYYDNYEEDEDPDPDGI